MVDNKLELDLENFVRLCHLHEKVHNLEQALAEKDKVNIALQERIAYYDRWLSNGVYYTNDEFIERVLKPRQQLMEKAVRFAQQCVQPIRGKVAIQIAEEAQAFLKERKL